MRVLRRDGEAEPAPLADRVEPQPAVRADDLTARRVERLARRVAEVRAQELVEADLVAPREEDGGHY